MKLSFVKNLIGSETLAKDILNAEGKVLLKAGSILTSAQISALKKYNIQLVYVKDSSLDDIREDKEFNNIKQQTLENMPDIFNNLVSSDYVATKESLDVVEHMVDYIIEQGGVNTSLYEVMAYDNYTYIHCVDTSIMSVFLGMSYGLDKNLLKALGTSAILHDIGKTKISSDIINKDCRLTKNEFDEIKKHPLYGKDILTSTNLFPLNIINGVSHHHEKINGTGYPYGLKDNNISFFGKLISICDVFTAVSAKRSYRDRFDPKDAYELILSESDISFDKDLVQVFKNTFSIYPLGCCVKLSNNIEGYVTKQNKAFPDRPVIRVIYEGPKKEKIQPYEINLLNHTNIIITSLVY